MSITDKTRKMLWGRSGNLCAFCKAHLVIDASEADSESIVGDECHIVSGAPNGPRHHPTFTSEIIDNVDNLILLCRIHHKLVDDQAETFTADALRQLKHNHEKWVKERLTPKPELEPIRVVRTRSEVPKQLFLVTSAKQLLDVAIGCHGQYQDYPDNLDENELDSVGSFLQNIMDWVDIGLNEPQERISAQKSIAEELSNLDQANLLVYAAREKQQLRGGVGPPSEFFALHLKVIRRDDPIINKRGED